MNVHIILFYKFTDIDNPGDFACAHLDFCKSEGLLGKVLVAKEGINGSVSGSRQQIERYKAYLRSRERFSDITFKEETGTFSPFNKMIVRVKKEIIRMDRELDLTKTGKYISPEELLELYEGGEDFIMLDTRNNYESRVGRFRDAVTPDIDTFREFPQALKTLEGKKGSKIVTYCTGGIRCEKATAYMIEQGFEDVYQLKDGILNFCQQYPGTIWEGRCFVFDQRLISDSDPRSGTIAKCVWCGESSDRYSNCRNPACDDLVIICEGCARKESGCCSRDCADEYKDLNRIKSRERQGYKFKENITKED